ncbi:MAG: hypothetical protein EXR72_26105 [Myxococcales bacterium]|nr:hypothetical protein [Myxococcales bacterium]
MRVVVDTDVVAAILLREAGRCDEGTRLLGSCRELFVPSHFKAELGNVIWKAIVLGGYPADQSDALLAAADALSFTVVDVGELWHGAVARAIAARHPVYDTLFVELAVRESIFMASFDRPLRQRFPTIVKTPAALLA